MFFALKNNGYLWLAWSSHLKQVKAESFYKKKKEKEKVSPIPKR